MKKLLCFLMPLVVLSFVCNRAYAQTVTDVCGTEQVRLRAGNFQYGTIQWERSIDKEHWEVIPDAKDTILEFYPDEDMYYRAVITLSECPREYSDIAHVQMPPVANAGLDRVLPGTKVNMLANEQPGCKGTWRIIEGENASLSDIHDPSAELSGIYTTYRLEWTLTNVCGTSRDTVEVEFMQNRYSDQIVIVDDTDAIYSTPAQMEEGLYIIEFSEPFPAISTNTFLVGITTEDGFLRKVDSYAREGDTYYIQTSQASLEDIIEEGGLNLDQVFSIDESLYTEKNGIIYAGQFAKLDRKPTRKELTSDPKFKEGDYFYVVREDQVYLYPGVELNHPADKSAKIGLSFNNVIFRSGNMDIKLGGHYWLKPNFVADIKVKWFKLKYFKMGLSNATIERQIHLTSLTSGPINISNRDYTLYSKSKDHLFIIGGLPLWIKSEFSIGGRVSATSPGSVNITQGMSETFTYNAYIEYKKSWKYVFNEKSQTQPVLSFANKNNLTQTFELGPKLSFKLYGIIGPYVGVGLRQDFNLCFSNQDWNTRMKLSGDIFVGANAKVLGKTLFDTRKTWSRGLYSYQFPHNLQITRGNNQTYTPGSPLAQKVQVKVNSDKAFHLPGAVVRFTPKGGGSVQDRIVTADARGFAETVWTPAGGQNSELEAKVLDCSGRNVGNSPVIFTAYAKAGSPDCEKSTLSASVVKEGKNISPKAHMGVPPYTYSTNGVTFNTQVPSVTPSPGITYTFYVKDKVPCQVSYKYSAPVIDCDHSGLQLELNIMGTTIEAAGNGGTPPYQYSLTSGTTGFTTANVFNGLPIGIHTVYLKDDDGCIKSEKATITADTPPIHADFMANRTSILTGETVQFENLSNNASSWYWDFGDGHSSTLEDPAHTYTRKGFYTVSLTVKNKYAEDQKTINNYISVKQPMEMLRQPCPGISTVTDVDGNVYDAILIGEQCWMAENLKTTQYSNGLPIDFPADSDADWNNNLTGAYSWYLKDPGNKNLYGALYNWHAVNSNYGLCPSGWHVPGDEEWDQLISFIVTNVSDITHENSGSKLKSCRQEDSPFGEGCNTTVHPRWDRSSIHHGSDEFGFSAFAGGIRVPDGSFYMIGERGKFWSSDGDSDLTAWNRVLSVHHSGVDRESNQKTSGFSIRCVRTEGAGAVLPTILTLPVTDVTATSASGGGNAVSDGGAAVTARGICWSASPNPTITNNLGMTNDGSGTGTFISKLTGLNVKITYYVRAYATNSAGTAYGNLVQFSTDASLPTIITSDITDISQTGATGGGNVTSDGGSTVTARGICWSTTQQPTITSNLGMTSNGTGTGAFTSYLSGLTVNTTYYVRAYATNSMGTAYGNQVQFVTGADLPTVITNSVTNITQTSATGGGNVTSDGGSPVTVRGVCLDISSNPTVENNMAMTYSGSGTGSFTSQLEGLTANTTYYVRAYATNSVGTAYGNLVQFTAGADLPTVVTGSITNITKTSATGGGDVTNSGGSAVTHRGICWSTSQNPTILMNQGLTYDGPGTGTFTSYLTGLTANTTYYVRAYAINSTGIAYGEQVQFKTSSDLLPTVTTASITNITQTSATGGGNVSSSGASTVTARGVCWSTLQNPTITTNLGKTVNGSGTGAFTSNLTGLTANTTYYVRAYATNSYGTAYGDQVQFITSSSGLGQPCPGLATVQDRDGNVYNTVQIGNQCWMKENLKTTKYRNGTAIAYPGSDDTGWSNNTAGAYAWYNNDISYKNTYGALYNWYAVKNSNGLCPVGWHVPSDSEWTQLVNYVVSQGYPNSNIVNGAGNSLKSCRQVSSPLGGICNTSAHPRWNFHNTHYGFDKFGFSALPGGHRFASGIFYGLGIDAYWWSATEYLTGAFSRYLFNDSGNVSNSYFSNKKAGYSVRCVLDEPPETPMK